MTVTKQISLTKLTIQAYDDAELVARHSASYPALRSFAPASFTMVGFPTRVTNEIELRRYADIMYEIADREYWLKTLLYSTNEQALITLLRGQIEELTGALFGRPVQALMCLFPPIPILRLVEAISAKAGRKLRILEIGPGSGYFGAYCLMQGHQYIGIDNTQALYLWQHRLFNHITDGDLCDFALQPGDVSGALSAKATLVPWWKFAEMFRQSDLPEIDIIFCEAAMGEMDPFGVRYLIHLSKLMLARSKVGFLLYQNLGEERQSSRETVAHLFSVNGFRQFKCGSVSVQAGGDPRFDSLITRLETLPPIGDCPSSAMKTANEFLKSDPAKLMESYSFFDFLRLNLG